MYLTSSLQTTNKPKYKARQALPSAVWPITLLYARLPKIESQAEFDGCFSVRKHVTFRNLNKTIYSSKFVVSLFAGPQLNNIGHLVSVVIHRLLTSFLWPRKNIPNLPEEVADSRVHCLLSSAIRTTNGHPACPCYRACLLRSCPSLEPRAPGVALCWPKRLKVELLTGRVQILFVQPSFTRRWYVASRVARYLLWTLIFNIRCPTVKHYFKNNASRIYLSVFSHLFLQLIRNFRPLPY